MAQNLICVQFSVHTMSGFVENQLAYGCVSQPFSFLASSVYTRVGMARGALAAKKKHVQHCFLYISRVKNQYVNGLPSSPCGLRKAFGPSSSKEPKATFAVWGIRNLIF